MCHSRVAIYETVAKSAEAKHVLFVELVKSFQPNPASLANYSVFSHPEALFNIEWLFHGPLYLNLAPFALAIQFTIPLAIVALLTLSFLRQRNSTNPLPLELLVTWLVSGLVIMIMLPEGWLHHDYYLWALLTPLAISGGTILARLMRLLRPRIDRGDLLAPTMALLILSTSIGYAGAVELQTRFDGRYSDIPGFNRGELQDAGERIAELEPTSPSAIVFVGDWGDRSVYRSPGVYRVLIYGHIHIRDKGLPDKPGIPRFVPNESATDDCEISVIRNGRNVTVEQCP